METVKPGPRKCLFCRMNTSLQFLRLNLCAICRDQVYDFLWVSAVQGLVVIVFQLGPLFFIVEEILLFFVLVTVKHRFPPPWEGQHHH